MPSAGATRGSGWRAGQPASLPGLLCVPCLRARLSSRWMRFSRYSCFLPSISSVSRSRARASCGLGAARLREELPRLKNLPNLLMLGRGRSRVLGLRSDLRPRLCSGINKLLGQVTHTPGHFLAPPRPRRPGGGEGGTPPRDVAAGAAGLWSWGRLGRRTKFRGAATKLWLCPCWSAWGGSQHTRVPVSCEGLRTRARARARWDTQINKTLPSTPVLVYVYV